MSSANTETVVGMLDEVVEGLSRRGHEVIRSGFGTESGIAWCTVRDEDGRVYEIRVEAAR